MSLYLACFFLEGKMFQTNVENLMFIGPCIILIVKWRETNLMSLALLFLYLMLNMFRMLIHPSSGACGLFVELFHGLYCSVRIEVFALAYLFSGECLVVTCVVVLESVFLQILAAATSYGYWVYFVFSRFFDNVSWIYSNVVGMNLHIPCSMCVGVTLCRKKTKTHNLSSITFFFENRNFYEIMSENIVQRGSTQMTV